LSLFAIGDIHGRSTALDYVLKISEFDPENDTLIPLGDVVDGGYKTKKCIDILITIKNKILIQGNHDEWALHWMKTGIELPIWVHQGGYATMKSYNYNWKSVPKKHISFLESAIPYYIDNNNNIYVHGGFDPNKRIEFQDPYDIMWDRDIINYSRLKPIPNYNHVFIGHTTTQIIDKKIMSTEPLTFNNLTMLDTGAGWNGKLTIMNTETRMYWQSKKQREPK
jgi:serine/threonine protein phosphatase 1